MNMNRIRVDLTQVHNLIKSGKALYIDNKRTTDEESANSAAIAGRLFTDCSLSADDIQRYLDIEDEIEVLWAEHDRLKAKLLDDADLALVDYKYKTFELEGLRKNIQVVRSDFVTLNEGAGKRVYDTMAGDKRYVTRKVLYSIKSPLKKIIRVLYYKAFVDISPTEATQELMKAHNISGTPEAFRKSIGSIYATRAKRLQELYGFSYIEAHTYAYLLNEADNGEALQKFLEVFNVDNDPDFAKNLLDAFAVDRRISVTTRDPKGPSGTDEDVAYNWAFGKGE
ncbi:MAG: hypothetical protein RSC43_01050 [Clostridia bacterium]